MKTEEDDDRGPFWWDLEGTETTFVENMQVLRQKHGLSQTEFARQLREQHGLPFHQPTVQRIEAGQRPVKVHEAASIARLFKTTFREMTEDVSLTFAYEQLLEETRWRDIQWTVTRAADTLPSVRLRVTEIEDSLRDYRAALEKFGAQPNKDAIRFAEQLIVHLQRVAEIFHSRDDEVNAEVEKILELVEKAKGNEARVRDYHGERTWLRDFKREED